MLNYIKKISCYLIDVEGAQIPLSEETMKLNISSENTPLATQKKNYRSFAEMEHGKFRRLFNRHRIAYGY